MRRRARALSSTEEHTANFVDVRHYVSTLVAWWREIILVVLLAAGTSAFFQWRQGPTYQAVADVAIVSSESALSRLVHTHVELGAPYGQLARRMYSGDALGTVTFLGLVHQDVLAQRVWSRLGDRFAGASAAGLLGRIEAELVSYRDLISSDMIRITATGSTPRDAAALANAWAEEYVEHIRQWIQWPEKSLEAVRSEMASAMEVGDDRQRRLEAFVAESDLDALKRQLAANDRAIATLWDEHNRTLTTQPNANEGQGDGLTEAIEAIEAASRALAVEIEAENNKLALLTDERDAAHLVLRALREEVANRRINNTVSMAQVRIGVAAAAPTHPASRNPSAIAMIAGTAVLPVAVVFALFAQLLGIRPPIASLAGRAVGREARH